MIGGIDPSTKKLAIALWDQSLRSLSMVAIGIPEKLSFPERLHHAEEAVRDALVMRSVLDELVVYVEAPFMHPKNLRGSIPLCQMNGAILAGCVRAGATVYSVVNTDWKTRVVGKGNAGKPAIKTWARKCWPAAYDMAAGDQDLIDAAAICRYGILTEERAVQLAARRVKRILKKRS